MNHYAGLDVSVKTVAICVIDEKGKIHTESEMDNCPITIAKYLFACGVPLTNVGLETGPMSHHLTKELREYGLPVVCMDARHLNPFLATKVNKTDKNDARGIAEALRLHAYKEVHLKAEESMLISSTLNSRQALVEARVKLTNSIRGMLKPFGVGALGSSSSLSMFHQRCDEAMRELPTTLKNLIYPLLEVLKAIVSQIKELDSIVDGMAKEDPQTKLLMEIPGVGPVVALKFRSSIDEVGRFSNSKAVGAYFGLTPTQYSSGETTRQGRISKCGSRRTRTLLVEAAGVMLTRTKSWSKLKAWGLKIMKHKGYRKAAVAVARKLAILMHRMLITGESFRFGEEVTA